MMCVRMMGFVLLFALAANAEAVTRLEEIPFEKLQAQCCLKKSSPIVPGFSIEKGEKGRYVFQDCSSFYSGDFLSFEKFLRVLFSMKRKQVGTILKGHYPTERWEKSVANAQILRTDRAESFNLDQVHILYSNLI